MKILLFLILFAILASLGQALYFLARDRGRSERTARALTWRIGLSLLLFLLLMAGFWLGWVPMQPSRSQVNEGPSRVFLSPSGGGSGLARPWGYS